MADREALLKKPTTYQEQIDLIKSKGFLIEDEKEAIEILKKINYYRISGYMLTFKKKDLVTDPVGFQDVYSLYEFDKKLRSMMLEILEAIEISFRAHITYVIAHKYGTLGYEKQENFRSVKFHEAMMTQLKEELDRSNEIFVAHHKERYQGLFPVWVALEVTSFGLLSKIYSNLKIEDQNIIGQEHYGVKPNFLRTWLHSLATLRNICAHYGRIYNRTLDITPKLFKKEIKQGIKNNTAFAALFVMGKLLKSEKEWNNYVTGLSALVEKHEPVNLELLGFVDGWEDILRNINRGL